MYMSVAAASTEMSSCLSFRTSSFTCLSKVGIAFREIQHFLSTLISSAYKSPSRHLRACAVSPCHISIFALSGKGSLNYNLVGEWRMWCVLALKSEMAAFFLIALKWFCCVYDSIHQKRDAPACWRSWRLRVHPTRISKRMSWLYCPSTLFRSKTTAVRKRREDPVR